MPSPTKPTSPTTINTRLHTTLADLQSQRTALIASFPSTISSTTVTKPAEPSSSNPTTTITPPIQPPSPSPSSSSPAHFPHEQLTITQAHAIVKRHIRLLHDYNAIRDVGQGLLGLIADQRGVRLVDVMEEFGAEVGD